MLDFQHDSRSSMKWAIQSTQPARQALTQSNIFNMNPLTRFRFTPLLAAICFLCAGLNAQASHSPNLDAAIDSLKAAQKANDAGADALATDPTMQTGTSAALSPDQVNEVTADLQKALKSLNRATNDKGGKRDAVIGMVNDAINLVKAGNREDADKKIEHAITQLFAAANHRGAW
jgi:hypothetical protein